MGYYCRSNFDANTPFVITAGAAGDVGSCKEAFWAADDCLCLKCSNIVNNKFVLFFLETFLSPSPLSPSKTVSLAFSILSLKALKTSKNKSLKGKNNTSTTVTNFLIFQKKKSSLNH